MPPTEYQGETSTRDRRFVEDDLMQLAEIDDQIRNMLARRESIVNDIKKANASNTERVNASDDWFEALKGNPVPARMADAGLTPRNY